MADRLQKVTFVAFHLTKKSGNFGKSSEWEGNFTGKSPGKLEIVEFPKI